MPSEPDDLEQALQENLKIRRKLARKTWEVRERNAKERVGWALYYTSVALAGLWILFWLWMLYGGFSEAQSRGVDLAICAQVFPLGNHALTLTLAVSRLRNSPADTPTIRRTAR
jgi:hypothetical protein